MSTPRPDCPDSPCWQALLEDALPLEQRERCERHLESCPNCQERIDLGEEYQAILRRLGRQFGDPTATPADPTLLEIRDRLTRANLSEPSKPESGDLSFLRPAGRPDLLGLLGEYEVQEVIGEGGMGLVLKAFDPALRRLVAIKVMAAAIAGNATARRRFTREARAAAAVSHDHVVAIHGVHEAEGLPYLVMQYVPGESLQARLDRNGPLEVVEIVRIGLQTALGLAAAHSQGLIHRDIKPANLLLEDGLAKVKITDFGLARLADDVQLTQHGVVAGTPEYMAPEQARGETIDHRADLFSLGSVLYALCTGQPPFRASTTLAVLRRVSDEAPRPIRDLNPDVPAWLEAFIARLMAKDPVDRFQSAAEVAALLETYLAHLRQPTHVTAPELPLASNAPKRVISNQSSVISRWSLVTGHWSLITSAAVALLLVLGLGIGWWALAGDGPEPRPQEHRRFWDFRQPFDTLSPAVVFGPQGAAVVTTDAKGLRITLPADRSNPELDVGVELPLRIGGNFDIDVGYELLAVGEPTPEAGAGVQLMIVFDSAPEQAAKLTRMRKPTDPFDPPSRKFEHVGSKGETFGAARIHYGPDGKETKLDVLNFRAGGPQGRLKLKRVGSQLEYWCVDGKSEYHKVRSVSVGAEDLHLIRLIGYSGNRPVAVDVRFSDLVVDADRVKELKRGATVLGGTFARPRRYLWLALGLFAAVFVSIGALGYYRYRGKRNSLTSEDTEAGNETTTPPISFQCSGCHRKLKARPDLAGKKVRCPQCGNQVAVPALQESKSLPPEGRTWPALKLAAVVAVPVVILLLIVVAVWMGAKSTPPPVSDENPFRTAVERVRALESDTIDVNSHPEVTDKDLALLQGLPNLRHLNLEHTSVTDAGMKDVARCTNLVSLYVSWTGVTDAGLAELRNLKRLENLRLNELDVTDAGLVHVQAFPQLRKLSLFRTQVTDAGMVHLKDLFFLEHLSLDQTAVTDRGLRPLHELSNLRYLTVWESKVTDAGAREIRAALPRLRVNK